MRQEPPTLTTKPMELDGGNWQEDVNGIPTLILLMVPQAQVDSYLQKTTYNPLIKGAAAEEKAGNAWFASVCLDATGRCCPRLHLEQETTPLNFTPTLLQDQN